MPLLGKQSIANVGKQRVEGGEKKKAGGWRDRPWLRRDEVTLWSVRQTDRPADRQTMEQQQQEEEEEEEARRWQRSPQMIGRAGIRDFR